MDCIIERMELPEQRKTIEMEKKKKKTTARLREAKRRTSICSIFRIRQRY